MYTIVVLVILPFIFEICMDSFLAGYVNENTEYYLFTTLSLLIDCSHRNRVAYVHMLVVVDIGTIHICIKIYTLYWNMYIPVHRRTTKCE